jgi:ubiquinone/menaquinone biosynthesis C-methylase UbiE
LGSRRRCDLEVSNIPFDDASFDVVICEQVLEHLAKPEFVLYEIARVLRRGGLLIAGTTTYWPGELQMRRYAIPLLDRLVGMSRSHKQIFSHRLFVKIIEHTNCLSIHQIRGFRIISGGPFSWLENFYWWYRLNRLLGRLVPWLCPDIQIVAIHGQSSS